MKTFATESLPENKAAIVTQPSLTIPNATPTDLTQPKLHQLTLSAEQLAYFEQNLKTVKASKIGQHDMVEYLGIEFTQCDPGYVVARMKVDHRTCRTCQPVNILNGGASLALAENMAGLGSLLLCPPHFHPCGIQVSANHLRMVTYGHTVTAIGRLEHFGSTLHLWQISILDEKQRLVSSINVTNMIIDTKI